MPGSGASLAQMSAFLPFLVRRGHLHHSICVRSADCFSPQASPTICAGNNKRRNTSLQSEEPAHLFGRSIQFSPLFFFFLFYIVSCGCLRLCVFNSGYKSSGEKMPVV
ncbi:hypothetical protein CEXT_298521 [Caerostris extrusa]|uniref:Secreted protein n=1 Tax=Caerostris extrusa TaxID=172846 RepID=A0AAV4QB30_CAEEX|nr:hypothetical protein CEXT_298521 [Caerostris extrusa]